MCNALQPPMVKAMAREPPRTPATLTPLPNGNMADHAWVPYPQPQMTSQPGPLQPDAQSPDMVLHGESCKRLATPRNTKDKKHLQSTQSAQPTNLTDQAPSTTERTAWETHNTN